MKFQLGAMTVGDILDRGLKILFSRLPTFFIINLLFLSPTLVFQLAFPPGGQADQLMALVMGFAAMLLAILGSAAILHVIEREFAGRPVGVGSAVVVALSCFWSLLGATILFGLLLLLTMIGALVPGMFVVFIAAQGGPVMSLPILVAVLLGVFAVMAWVIVRFCFFSQVVVMERSGAAASLVRSKDLGLDHGWRIFGVLILVALIHLGAVILEGVLNVVLPGTEWLVETNERGFITSFEIILVDYQKYAINTVVAFLFNIIVSSYLSVCLTLLYFDLRIRKEGFDLELAAQQELPQAMPVSPMDAPPAPEEMPGTYRPW